FIETFESYIIFSVRLFSCYVDHRDLHSFPTRCSSDLYLKLILPLTSPGRSMPVGAPKPKLLIYSRSFSSPNSSYPNLMKATLLEDRKSTRLNSSHVKISYAVFCLKKKK